MDELLTMADQSTDSLYLKPTVTTDDFIPYGEKLTQSMENGFSNQLLNIQSKSTLTASNKLSHVCSNKTL